MLIMIIATVVVTLVAKKLVIAAAHAFVGH